MNDRIEHAEGLLTWYLKASKCECAGVGECLHCQAAEHMRLFSKSVDADVPVAACHRKHHAMATHRSDFYPIQCPWGCGHWISATELDLMKAILPTPGILVERTLPRAVNETFEHSSFPGQVTRWNNPDGTHRYTALMVVEFEFMGEKYGSMPTPIPDSELANSANIVEAVNKAAAYSEKVIPAAIAEAKRKIMLAPHGTTKNRKAKPH